MDDWTKNQQSNNITELVNTQNTQYAIEKASSVLSDPAFQSFLTNAPIPRVSGQTPIGVITGGTASTVLHWSVKTFDPYNMLDLTTGNITCPVAGFYIVSFALNGTVTAGSQVRYIVSDTAVNWGLTVVNPLVVANTVIQGATTAVVPVSRAGQILTCTVIVDGAANLTGAGGSMSCVWIAPYNNYVTGGQ